MRVHADNWTEIHIKPFKGASLMGFVFTKRSNKKTRKYESMKKEAYMTRDELLSVMEELEEITNITAIRRAGEIVDASEI